MIRKKTNTVKVYMNNIISGHTNTINKIFFKKTKPTELMSCSSDRTICVWDTTKKVYIKYWSCKHFISFYWLLFMLMLLLSAPKEVWTMAINADETILASACDTDIYIWYVPAINIVCYLLMLLFKFIFNYIFKIGICTIIQWIVLSTTNTPWRLHG